MSERDFDIAPKCKTTTIWRLSQKWMDEKKEPQSPEEWKELLDRLTGYMGGMIKQTFWLMTTWEETFPKPDCYQEWDCDGIVNTEERDSCIRYQGTEDALEHIRRRHSDVYDDLALMICGR